MNRKIAVFCRDKYLGRKIQLILSGEGSLYITDDPRDVQSNVFFDLVLWNTDDAPLSYAAKARVITMGQNGELPLPFNEKMLFEAVEAEGSENTAPLTLGDKCARLYDEIIRFTDMEFALLSVLASANGEFVPRETLISKVWGEGSTDGLLNVYVHYLREKLEYRGEKIIISSRKLGYKIDKRYLVGGGEEV